MATVPKWFHEDHTECVSGHDPETMKCLESGGFVNWRVPGTEPEMDLNYALHTLAAASHREETELLEATRVVLTTIRTLQGHVELLRERVTELEISQSDGVPIGRSEPRWY